MFDPYHKWLGIPKNQRPPTFYQLLGISPNETDLEVIDEAAIRQTAHIRTYQIGPHAKECTQILNEIALARTTILSAAKRQEYDALLAKKAADSQRTLPSTQITASAPTAPSVFANLEDEDTRSVPPRVKAKKKVDALPSIEKEDAWLTKPMLYAIISGGGGLLLVLVFALIFGLGGSRRPADVPVAAQKEDSKPKKGPVQPAINPPQPEPQPEPKIKKDDLPPNPIPNSEDKKLEDKKKDPVDVKEPPPEITPPPAKPDPPRPSQTNVAKDWRVDPRNGEVTIRHYGGDAPGTTADLSPNGEFLVIAAPGRDLILADVKTGAERMLLAGAAGAHHPVFVKDGTQILVAVREPSERLVLLSIKGQVIWQVNLQGRADVRWLFLAPAADRRHVLAGASDNTMRTLDVEAIKGPGQFAGRYTLSDTPSSGGFSSDGRVVFGAGANPTKAWVDSLETGTNNRTHHAFANCVVATMSKSSEYLMFANFEHSLLLAKRRGQSRVFGKHEAPVQSLAFSSDDNLAASADEKGQVSIWDLKQNTDAWRGYLPPAQDRKVEFVRGDRYLLVTGDGVDLFDFTPEPRPNNTIENLSKDKPKDAKEKISKASKSARVLLERVRTAVSGGRIVRSPQMGRGKEPYEEVPKEGGLLVGFEVTYGRYGINPTITTIRPIFLTAAGRVLGTTHGAPGEGLFRVEAKPGYAVGAVTIKAGLGVDGMSVTFMEIRENGLNPNQNYESEWLGGTGGFAKTTLLGTGAPIVGIYGRTADAPSTFNCLGLITAAVNK